MDDEGVGRTELHHREAAGPRRREVGQVVLEELELRVERRHLAGVAFDEEEDDGRKEVVASYCMILACEDLRKTNPLFALASHSWRQTLVWTPE